MKRCKKCIMPESYPGTVFNNEGICGLCLNYKPHHACLGRDRLVDALNSETRTGAYDCVIPISGGKDSTFILYYAVRELGLKPVAVTYDSGFQTDIAKENMRQACEILNVPFLVVKSPDDVQSKLLRESLLVSKKVGYLTRYCGNCEAIIRSISINTARNYRVPFVLWGGSALETLSNEFYDEYRNIGRVKRFNPTPVLRKTRSRIRALVRNPQKILQLPRRVYPYIGYHAVRYDIFSIQQRLQLGFPIKYALRPHSIPPFTEQAPRFIHFFDYIAWDSINNLRILKEELGWKHPPDRTSRFDCAIHCFANYDFLSRYGISHDGVNFCNFVREHKMDREEAMAREESIRDSVARECQEVIQGIGLKDYCMP